MKKLLILTLVFFGISTINAKKCPKPTLQKYRKVMSSAFAKEYSSCPVIIEAQYLKEGYLTNMRKPRKLKKMYFFQCTSIGGDTKNAPLTNEPVGDFFVIDKKKADLVLDLKKGQKIRLTGKTFVQKFFGVGLSVFFIVSDIEVIE